VQLELLGFLAQLDSLGSQALKDLQATLGLLASKESKVVQDCLDQREPLVFRDLLDQLDRKASLVRVAQLVKMANQVS